MDATALRARALALLALREHSREELRRKLVRWAQSRLARTAAEADAEAGPDGDGVRMDAVCEPPDRQGSERLVEATDALLADLEARGWLSDQRALESRLRAIAPRAGSRKLAADLQQRGLKAEGAAWEAVRATEAQRARELLCKRFGEAPPADLAEQARRQRFLLNRGFEPGLAARLSRQALQEDGP